MLDDRSHAKSDAQRQRERYLRRKIGLHPQTVDVPESEFRQMLIAEGWLKLSDAHDRDKIRLAASRMLQKQIYTSRRERYALEKSPPASEVSVVKHEGTDRYVEPSVD